MKAPYPSGGSAHDSGGFTLLEILVASAVLALIVLLALQSLAGLSSVTSQSTAKVVSFQTARMSFGFLENELGQATLNSFWDYVDNSGTFLTSANSASFVPDRYARNSQLHFLIGTAGSGNFPGTQGTGLAVCFQIPAGLAMDARFAGLPNLINEVGYYVEYSDQEQLPEPFSSLQPRYRYRLFRSVVPSENVTVYSTSVGATSQDWLSTLSDHDEGLAENVVFMAIWPKKSPALDPEGDDLTTDFSYDSRKNASNNPQPDNAHQLPPIVQVMLVMIDEETAQRFCISSTAPSQISAIFKGLFETSSEAQFQQDLETMKGRFASASITGYRVFHSTVPLRESKMQ